ncbi:MAG: heme exporter protein CcmB, partial [Pseudomonadota bacterium]|nr:heme exporter protein CcmB [Pseudomonadota bacterium]
LFFILVCIFFPLAVGQDVNLLRSIGPGVIWVTALLATLISLGNLFRIDFSDGSLSQLALSDHPLTVLLFAKSISHWITNQLPLVLLAPFLAIGFDLPIDSIEVLFLSLLIGTPALSMLGSLAAALAAGLQQSTGLIALLLLPLCAPILIFGARGSSLVIVGQDIAGSLYLLGALTLLILTLTPFATAAAVRVSLD